ncbi:putative EF-hand domain pair protein [Rosa chinensis]|uniref:Putative EF-hand domain pair protein n=1 Tax=Rosa chinensis TaxID=74649 RepID=A0A2P6R876_ROSCH|nr:calcium-binding protein CML42 [Rosa chinensis]PRQ42627.1 putative EF-hand domain pair protein [Rosa chinensis]
MEAAAPSSAGTSERTLTRRPSVSSSFRLRSPSLNSLRLLRIFDVFDKNRDGMVSVEEISQALGLLGLDVEVSELERTIRTFIQPGNEGLKFEDFVGLHQSLYDTFFFDGDDIGNAVEEAAAAVVAARDEEEAKKLQEESDLREAFKVFDEDGDGYISAKELQTVLGKLGFPEGNEIDRVEKMITSVDRNHDGLVDLFEFKHMMRSTLLVPSS